MSINTEPAPGPDLSVSLVRTFTPVLVGLILGVVGTQVAGINEAALTPAISALLTAFYYTAVRALEHKWPAMGWLLGAAKKPSY